MPAHTPNDPSYPQYPAPVYPTTSRDDEIKAPYDDLIDQYATPYGTQANRTFAVDPASMSRHGRQPSVPLSKHSYETSKDFKSLDGHGRDPPDWEYPPQLAKEETAEKEKKTWRSYIPDSLACRLYLLTVLVETAIDLAIEGDIFLRFHQAHSSQSQDMATRRMPVYLSIFAMAHVFQFIMALDAVWARNVLQFISLAIFNALFLLYAIIQITEINAVPLASSDGITHVSINTLAIIIPIVISVAEVAYIALGWKIYTEFGWKVYKFLGADRRIKTMFTHHQIFLCLVKFDLFFWVGFSVQFIFLVLSSHNAEFYLTCAALPLSIVVLIEGHLAARHENKWMMLSFMTGCGGAMVYFVYKLVKVLRFKATPTFSEVWQTLTTFSIIAIILLIITFIFALLVMSNFGRGLKAQIEKNKHKTAGGLARGKSQYVHRGPMSTHPNRMSID
ncbi:hypothetical protein BD309DRAFT_127067 [Dichomitus squalens]|uniref:uncharacterized protein n=1 Tax=Dichomitus squalens (strain LYAD-421) TaxID=732165 RepID=UPI00044154AD|nr:uncharacterized protein DICSQDRAFT_75219 [Dichomitus squalens LYAD-421 SS1]EJF66490.1 hypothetical protein DICSQDRAFT_75219 [Dichomitus squalens LYAD-421 SS1]TBU43208.1 hypothetical protein BD309DRAFT_127067 [Dichomitus squalens]